jgi:hypothetical protein
MNTHATLVVLVAALASVGAAGSAGLATAQESDEPSVTLTGGTIDVDAGETSTVTTSYEFTIESAGSGDQRLTSIDGRLWKFPDRSVDGLSATVNGAEVTPEVTERDRHYELSVPVEDVSSGDTVTVTVTYEVAGPAGELKVPVFAPDHPTTGESTVIDLRVELPEGQQLQGDAFPRPDSTSGNVVTSELLHVPGFVTLQHGSSGGIGLNAILSTVGVVLILGVIGGWAVVQRRRAQRLGGGEPDVQ